MVEPSQPTAASGEPGVVDVDPLIGRLIDGRYRILSLIASGGMGRVYKAEQASLSRTVALKVLTHPVLGCDQDPLFRERFQLEATTVSRLSSPNIVTLFDHGRTDDGIYYIVMEYVEGTTLGQLLKSAGGRLPPERALLITRQVCQALWEAHAQGVIHRDIKPSNILVVQRGYELVKVLDFGIAKLISEREDPNAQLTSHGTFVGTPEYSAPETFYGRAEPRSDIYSVGVLLYFMLSGRLPFQGNTPTASALMAVFDAVPRLDASLNLPKGLEALVLRCLEKEPDRRFQSIDELLRIITASLTGSAAVGELPTGWLKRQSAAGLEAVTLEPPGNTLALPRPFLRRRPSWPGLFIGLARAGLLGAGGLALVKRAGSSPSGPAPDRALEAGNAPADAAVPARSDAPAASPAREPASSSVSMQEPAPASPPAQESAPGSAPAQASMEGEAPAPGPASAPEIAPVAPPGSPAVVAPVSPVEPADKASSPSRARRTPGRPPKAASSEHVPEGYKPSPY